MRRIGHVLLLGAALAAGSARAAESERVLLVHQGRLLDARDEPVAGTHHLVFRIFSQHEPHPGETPLWTGDYPEIALTRGSYAVALGEQDAQPLPAQIFEGVEQRWLSITVGGTELLPRLRVGSVPRAVSASKAALATRALDADKAALATRALDADKAALATRATDADRADDAAHLEGQALADLDARYAKVGQGGSLVVAGELQAGTFKGDGAALTSLSASALAGTLGAGVVYKGQPIEDAQIASAAAWNAKVGPTDPRLGDARDPKPGSSHYVQNGAAVQTGQFNLSGNGTLGGDLFVGGLVKLGTNTACSTGVEGSLRYSAAAKRVEFCNGARWLPIAADFTSCRTILESGASTGDGVYRLTGRGAPVDVTCDMTTDGGGWTRVTGALINAQSWMSFAVVNAPASRSPAANTVEMKFLTADSFTLDPLNGAGCADDVTMRATVKLPFSFDHYRGSWKAAGKATGTNHDDNDTTASWGSRSTDCNGHLFFGTDTHTAKGVSNAYGVNWNQNGASKTFTWDAKVMRTNEIRWEVEDQGAAEDVVFSNIDIWVR